MNKIILYYNQFMGTNYYSKDALIYEQRLRNVDIVSFDIFDTLLIRPYQKPTDLFIHIEKHYNMPGFVNERILAENRARYKSGKEDITIDDIYNEIQDKYKPLKEKELEIEYQVLSAHPVMKQLYEIALKKGKKVIAISDMYLTEDFLRKLLNKNGYSSIDKIYVSSKIGKCKHTKNLYKYVCEDLEIDPKKILHIGDNVISDFIRAKKSGLNALHIDTYISRFNKTLWGKRFLKFEKNYNSLDFSVLKAMIAQYIVFSENDDYWYTLAYILGGILALGYVQFIDKRSQFFDINQLLFISRDGYLLEKIYNMYSKNPVKTQYIYAPRILNLKCFCDFRGNQDYFNTIIKLLHEENIDLKYNQETDNMFEFYNKNKQVFDTYANQHKAEYEKYLKTLKIDTTANMALVDGVTGVFSSLAFLKKFFNNKLILGLYICSFNDNYEFIYNTLFNKIDYKHNEFFVSLWELFLTSPEPPIIDIKEQNPVYAELNYIGKERLQIFKKAECAILSFINNYLNYFSKYNIEIQACIIRDFFEALEKTLTPIDKKHLISVYYTSDACNSVYIPILTDMNLYQKTKYHYKKFKSKVKHFGIKIFRNLKMRITIFIYTKM